MHSTKLKTIIVLVFCVISLYANAQKFEYLASFHGIGDNREFFSNKAMPQTILGSRGSFEAGINIDNHHIRLGASELYEFGSEINFHKPNLILYYHFEEKNKSFYFGSFPRLNLVNFPLAILTDTLLYYRPNIEGMLGQYRWDWGNQLAFIDWTSRQTDTKRETFMAGSSGEICYKNFFIENYLLMFHRAGPAIDVPGDHIKDYMGYSIRAGIRTPKEKDIQAHIKAGLLASIYRERSITDGYIKGNSLFAEAYAKYKNFASKTVLHTGDGHNFSHGDLFYRLNNYLRSDLIWYFINHKNVKGKFNLSFHVIEWNDLDQSQQLSIVYLFGK